MEVNGPSHLRPSKQASDERKVELCQERGIRLIVVDLLSEKRYLTSLLKELEQHIPHHRHYIRSYKESYPFRKLNQSAVEKWRSRTLGQFIGAQKRDQRLGSRLPKGV